MINSPKIMHEHKVRKNIKFDLCGKYYYCFLGISLSFLNVIILIWLSLSYSSDIQLIHVKGMCLKMDFTGYHENNLHLE